MLQIEYHTAQQVRTVNKHLFNGKINLNLKFMSTFMSRFKVICIQSRVIHVLKLSFWLACSPATSSHLLIMSLSIYQNALDD